MKQDKILRFSKFAVLGLAIFFVLCSQEKSFLKNISLSTKNEIVEKNQDSLNSALKLQQTLRNIAKSISPAVVNIRTEKLISQNRNRRYFDDPFFDRFFRDRQRQRKQTQKALGSGIIISADGYILSNNHVVAHASKIIVHLADRRSFEGKIVGTDEKTDLALIKVDTKGKPLPVAPLGDSDKIQVGDFALAVGNPFGLNWTFTFGVISATARSSAVDPNAPFKSYIQTDVSINPGNSGGPLVNIRGQVVGINTAIFSTSGGSIGIGFAVPINIAKNVIQQLITKGHVDRGYIGAYIQDVDEKLAGYYKLKKIEGVILTDIQKGSPAEKSGLKSGDVVLEVNGKKAINASQLVSMISNIQPGQIAKMKIIRNGKEMIIPVKIGKREDKSVSLNKGEPVWMGMKFGDIDENRRRFGIPDQVRRGLVVLSVKENSAAYEVGIRPGDIIDMINRKPITNLRELNNFLSKNGKKNQYLLRVVRGYRVYFIVLEAK